MSAPRGFRPLLDRGPVPAWSAAHGPSGVGEETALAPHVHGVRLHTETKGNLVGANWVTGHIGTIRCTVSLDNPYRQAVH